MKICNNNISPSFCAKVEFKGVTNYLSLLTEIEYNNLISKANSIGTNNDKLLVDLCTISTKTAKKKLKFSNGFLAIIIKTVKDGKKGKTYSDFNITNWLGDRLEVAFDEVDKYYKGFENHLK